ncbi:MAG: translation initiation factor IF-6 [Candidatus Nanoarchaeia archaeon]|nr:translation initiation factor IF-6 [Candidatus Nanoarchaeia archaeon]
MHAVKMNIRGSGLVGLYMLVTDKVVLVGNEVPESLDKTITEVLHVPIIRMSIAGTSLIGVFASTDGENIIVPDIIFEHEEDILKKSGIKYAKIHTNLTCLGTNVCATKKGVLIHPEFEESAEKQIKSIFSENVKRMNIGESPNVGSCLSHNSKFGLITPDVTDEEAEFIEQFLGIELTGGTVEMGSTQVKSGIIANDTGYIIGEHSGGPEIINADRAFGYSE